MWTAETRRTYDRKGLRYPTDVTDAEWDLARPFVDIAQRGSGRQRRVVLREVLNAVWACRKLWCRLHDGLRRPRFHALLTCGRPKQIASSRFCSHTVQAPAKPKPLRSHSIASNPWIVRRAVWKA